MTAPAPTTTDPAETPVAAPVVPPGAHTAPPGATAPATPPAVPAANGDLPEWMRGPDGSVDPKAAIAYVDTLRKENGRERLNAKEQAAKDAAEAATQALTNKIAVALGLAEPGEETSPEKLLEKAQVATEQAQREARKAKVELAVFRAADAAGGDAQALLDSRQFAAKLTEVDPADPAAVTEVIKAFIEEHPRYAAKQPGSGPAAPTPPAGGDSGAQFAGGTGGAFDINAQLADAMARGDVRESIRLKGMIAARQRAAS